MSTLEEDHADAAAFTTPDIYPRLAYRDEFAAIDYLTRVFQFVENREARMEHGEHCLGWLRTGSGVVMLGHTDADIHRIHSPLDAGLTTVMMNVYVRDIDQHYAHAVTERAEVTMSLEDAFYGERRYEVTDLEGPRWHFAEQPTDSAGIRGIHDEIAVKWAGQSVRADHLSRSRQGAKVLRHWVRIKRGHLLSQGLQGEMTSQRGAQRIPLRMDV